MLAGLNRHGATLGVTEGVGEVDADADADTPPDSDAVGVGVPVAEGDPDAVSDADPVGVVDRVGEVVLELLRVAVTDGVGVGDAGGCSCGTRTTERQSSPGGELASHAHPPVAGVCRSRCEQLHAALHPVRTYTPSPPGSAASGTSVRERSPSDVKLRAAPVSSSVNAGRRGNPGACAHTDPAPVRLMSR